MIYPYIKVNRKVVDYLGVTNDRYQFPDGNYMLWKFDLLPLGGNNEETIRMVGGVGMTSEQVREEQHGGTPTPLPEAEDERFRMDENEVSERVAVVEETPEEPARVEEQESAGEAEPEPEPEEPAVEAEEETADEEEKDDETVNEEDNE